MSKIFLIRHGQSEGNVDNRVYLQKKDFEIALTEKGLKQALKAGQKLKKMNLSSIEAFVSPYKRTRQTFKEINKSLKIPKIKIKENPLLREQEYKIFKDMEDSITKRTEREHFGSFWYRFKNAEATADVFTRVQTFYNHLLLLKLNGQLEENVVIVAHDIVIKMFLIIFDNIKVEKVDDLIIENCAIIEREL